MVWLQRPELRLIKRRIIIIDPNQFIETVTNSLNATRDKELERSSKEWEKRNSGDTISGSAFSKCLRLCYYRWFDKKARQPKDPVFTDSLDEQTKRYMYFGLLLEDILIDSLRKHGIPGGGIVHKDQDKEPVVMTSTVDGITRSAANDMVIEGLDDIGTFYIPTECKTTDRLFSFKEKGTDKWITPAKWWDSFTGYDEHKRQVMQWIWLANKNGYRVPFGCLFYLRRGTWEHKFIIIDASQGSYWDVPGAVEIIDYNIKEPELDQRNHDLVHSITNNVEPIYDPTIPKFVCKGCNYLKQCKESR